MDLSAGTLGDSREVGVGMERAGSKSRGPLKDYSIARLLNLGAVTEEPSRATSVPPSKDVRDSTTILQNGAHLVNVDAAPFSLPEAHPFYSRLPLVSADLSLMDDPISYRNESPLSFFKRPKHALRPLPLSPGALSRLGTRPRQFSEFESPARLLFSAVESLPSNSRDFLDRKAFPDDCLLRPQHFTLPHPFGGPGCVDVPSPNFSQVRLEARTPPILRVQQQQQQQQQRRSNSIGPDSEMPVLKAMRNFHGSEEREGVEDDDNFSSYNEDIENGTTEGQQFTANGEDVHSRSSQVDFKERGRSEEPNEETFPRKRKLEDIVSSTSSLIKDGSLSPELPQDEIPAPSVLNEMSNSTVKTPHLEGPMTSEPGNGGEEDQLSSRPAGTSTTEESTPRRKRIRTSFSQGQLLAMERLFRETHYPDVDTRTQLGRDVGLDENKIQIWFQNRRAKWRKVYKLSGFGGLQDIMASDYVPAPKVGVTASTDISSQFLEGGKPPPPRPTGPMTFPLPMQSAFHSIRSLPAPGLDPLTSKLYPGVFGPPLGQGTPLRLLPFPDPRLPSPFFLPPLLTSEAFEAHGSHQPCRVVPPDYDDLGRDLDRVKDVSRSHRHAAGSDASVLEA